MADINDVYVWNTSDATKINLVMTISPADNGQRTFGPTVQYVFHLTRHAAFPASAAAHAMGQESKIICTFTSNTAGQCWVVNPAGAVVDYVSGDLSGDTGRVSASGKFRVFAGRRSDPFFFNLNGFITARTRAEIACSGTATPGDCPGVLTAISDAAGCPALDASTSSGLVNALGTAQDCSAALTFCAPFCPTNDIDCFDDKNVMAIVVQVDKSEIVTDTQKIVGVWGSTHMGQ